VIEARFADTDQSRLPTLAKELVDLGVDVIVTFGVASVRAAKGATTTIPIVMAGGSNDVVGAGLVASIAHPGGNVTGLSRVPTDAGLYGKALQLFKEAVPNTSRVAILGTLASGYPGMQAAAEELNLTLLEHDVSGAKSASD